MPVIFKTPRTTAQVADLLFAMNQLNPKGFRKPGRNSYGLVERYAAAAYGFKLEPLPREAESRGKKFDHTMRREKFKERRANYIATVKAQQAAEKAGVKWRDRCYENQRGRYL